MLTKQERLELIDQQEFLPAHPLFRVGSFGVHILDCPNGKFAFFGSVPFSCANKTWPTYLQALSAFAEWYLHIEHLSPNDARLRKDIVGFLFNYEELKNELQSR